MNEVDQQIQEVNKTIGRMQNTIAAATSNQSIGDYGARVNSALDQLGNALAAVELSRQFLKKEIQDTPQTTPGLLSPEDGVVLYNLETRADALAEVTQSRFRKVSNLLLQSINDIMKKRFMFLFAAISIAASPFLVSCASTCKAKPEDYPPRPKAGGTGVKLVADAPKMKDAIATPAVESDALELKKETAQVEKQTVPAGQVRLRKVTTTEKLSLPVTLTHDEYVIERVPVGDAERLVPRNRIHREHVIQRANAPTQDFGDKQVSLTLQKETATVTIIPKVVETVRLKKVSVKTTTNITATVRTEAVITEKSP